MVMWVMWVVVIGERVWGSCPFVVVVVDGKTSYQIRKHTLSCVNKVLICSGVVAFWTCSPN